MTQQSPASHSDPRLKAAREIAAYLGTFLEGDVSVRLWNGEVVPLGPSARQDIQIAINTPSVVRRLILQPTPETLWNVLASGDVDIVGGSPLELLDRFDHGKLVHLVKRVSKLKLMAMAVPFLTRFGGGESSVAAYQGAVQRSYGKGRNDKEAIAYHYDVGNDFFALFLDEEMQYSCPYFLNPEQSLDDAQRAKLDRICRKLQLKPGDRLLDIGCGWGGLACHAARYYGVTVHGVTLSAEQLAFARVKAERLGLSDCVRFELKDYREIEGEGVYDKISQVEMFEHVGFKNHDRHFIQVRKLLRPLGLYFHQASVRRAAFDLRSNYRQNNVTKAVARLFFPGVELDFIGHTCTQLERHGFNVRDVENLTEHFALATRHWHDRLFARRAEATTLVGAARVRLWLLYLAASFKRYDRSAALCFQTVAVKRRAAASIAPSARGDLL